MLWSEQLALTLYSDLGKWRNKAGDADKPSVCEQSGHLSNATDVFFAVGVSEAQILVQAVANVVPIQRIARNSVRHEIFFQSKTNGGLPSTRQTFGKTDIQTFRTVV